MADIVAPSLAGPCLGEDLIAVRDDRDPPVGIVEPGEEVPIEVPGRRRLSALTSAVFAPYDKSAALLLWGALGLVVVLLLETIACMIVLGQGVIDAALRLRQDAGDGRPQRRGGGRARGPEGLPHGLDARHARARGLFTAGLVNRLINRRLTGLFGRRAVPRRDHVVVVGLGQVGLRLCVLLRRCGIGIVAVDNRESGENVGLGARARLPGGDRPRRRPVAAAPALARPRVRARGGDRRRPAEHLDRDGRAGGQRGPARGDAGRRRPRRQRDALAVQDRPRARRAPHRGGADRRARDGLAGGARRLRRRRRAPAARRRPPRGGGRLGVSASAPPPSRRTPARRCPPTRRRG